jgi:dolichol-phosphate mannosyltransferase
MPELAVVVPAFRERENIPQLLQALERALAGLDWETIVVVDDAFDGSELLVRERAQHDRRVRCVHRIGRRGLASACIEGMLASTAPYIVVLDADLQHDETLVPQLLAAARRAQADIAVASRYMAGGSTGELAPRRVRLSRLAIALSKTLCKGLTDPMSGFFLVHRTFLDRVVRKLYGRGFKILLDLIAAARGEIRVVELPYRMRSRTHGESKLSARVVAEFFMLLAYHLTGRLLPARFFLFAAVGVTGVGVHLCVLWPLFALSQKFLLSQGVATLAAMTSNFFLNNVFTYGDQRLRGRALWRGLLTFYAACGLGVLINLAVAEWLFLKALPYWGAGLCGAVVAALWNFFMTASLTWGGSAAAKRR